MGRQPTCTCGICKKCRNREYQRNYQRDYVKGIKRSHKYKTKKMIDPLDKHLHPFREAGNQNVNCDMGFRGLCESEVGKNQDQHQKLGDFKGTHNGFIEHIAADHIDRGQKHHPHQGDISY